jgi:hypothetical protein
LGAPTQYFTGKPSERLGPGGVAQYGSSIGDHIGGGLSGGGYSSGYRGDQVRMGAMPKHILGNEKALDVGGGGPGTGRTVASTGSQGQHGPVEGKVKPQGRDILSDYGNESPNVKGRR